jgi:uncharacterized membrane protein
LPEVAAVRSGQNTAVVASGRESQRSHRGTARPARARAAVVLAVLAAAAAAAVATAPPVAAFELRTDYPVVRVGPGEDAEMTLDVTSDRVERVALSIVEAPPGWRTRLTGGGFEIGAVFTDPDVSPTATLEVSVPDDATRGRYRVVVRGESGGQIVDLPIELEVAEDVAGAFALTTQFARLRGSATDTFRFDLTIESNSPREASFALSAAGPENWQIIARPSAQQQAATVTVEPGASATIQVEATPPGDVEAGNYPIVVRAEGAGTVLEGQLEVEIVGSFELALSTANERLDVSGTAGETTSVTLVVRNDGSAALRDVTFSATPPSGWDVEFRPERLDVIPPGEAVTVTARIRPDGDAVAGDYAVTLTASGSGQSETLDLRFAVETSGWWGFVGIAIIAAAVAVLLWVFRRFGRR